jgi:uncharacterized protein involved in exopolysaccharide biosynthesis
MEDRELTIKELWKIIWKRKKMIVVNVTIISIVTVIFTLFLPVWYKSTVVILPPESSSGAFSSLGMLGGFNLGGLLGGGEDQNRVLSILKSRSLLEAVANKYNFVERYGVDNMEDAIEAIEGNIDITLHEEMQISFSFWDEDQDQVSEITNYFIQCLDSINVALSTKKGKENRIFIEQRIENILNSLKILEKELTNFMEEEGILSLPDQVSVGVQSAAELKAQIMTKQIELAIAKGTYETNSAIIKQLNNELNSYKSTYNEFFQDSEGQKLLPNFTKIPKLGIKFATIERQIKYYIKVIEFLGPEYESAKIEEAKTISTIQVLDKAVRPEWKDKPKRARIVLIVFAFSLIINVYLAYFLGRREYTKSTS